MPRGYRRRLKDPGESKKTSRESAKGSWHADSRGWQGTTSSGKPANRDWTGTPRAWHAAKTTGTRDRRAWHADRRVWKRSRGARPPSAEVLSDSVKFPAGAREDRRAPERMGRAPERSSG